jgi:hypothetical protein
MPNHLGRDRPLVRVRRLDAGQVLHVDERRVFLMKRRVELQRAIRNRVVLARLEGDEDGHALGLSSDRRDDPMYSLPMDGTALGSP